MRLCAERVRTKASHFHPRIAPQVGQQTAGGGGKSARWAEIPPRFGALSGNAGRPKGFLAAVGR
jgi:hypothetical protein